jgi:hypothetical protein
VCCTSLVALRSTLFMVNLPRSPSMISILVFLFIKFHSCVILKVPQISFTFSKPFTLLYSSLYKEANKTVVPWAFYGLVPQLLPCYSSHYLHSICLFHSQLCPKCKDGAVKDGYTFYDSTKNNPPHQSSEACHEELNVNENLRNEKCMNN